METFSMVNPSLFFEKKKNPENKFKGLKTQGCHEEVQLRSFICTQETKTLKSTFKSKGGILLSRLFA